ncbi:MAG: TetR/AcrR family transcriptional regulator [Bauldia sp.]|nr:TetR/AcrR family transcriptional regulator [Bauldia sp.]
MDRRVARTRSALHAALIELMLTRGYDGTTVEEICRVAKVGRSTFYTHYADKDALKRDGLASIGRSLRQSRHETVRDDALGFVLPMLRHAREHVDHYRALAGGHGGSMALASIREILAGIVRQEMRSSRRRTVSADVAVNYLVGAFMAVLTWWLDRGAIESPEQMADAFRDLSAGYAAMHRPTRN